MPGTSWPRPHASSPQPSRGVLLLSPLSSTPSPLSSLLPQGTVFDYYVDEAAVAMAPWAQRVPRFIYEPLPLPGGAGGAGAPLFVATVETARLRYLLGLLAPNQHHVMFVGSSGELEAVAQGAHMLRSALCYVWLWALCSLCSVTVPPAAGVRGGSQILKLPLAPPNPSPAPRRQGRARRP